MKSSAAPSRLCPDGVAARPREGATSADGVEIVAIRGAAADR